MLEQRLQQQFFENADLHYASAEALVKPLLAGAGAVVNCVTSGARVLVAAEPGLEMLARHTVACLVEGLERERPPLAASCLEPLGAGLLQDMGAEQAFARQLQALGQPGDVLWVFSRAGRSQAVLAAVHQAHEKDMVVLAFTGPEAATLRNALSETDVHLAVPHLRATRVLELQLAAVHVLCDLVDVQLLGEME
jgi:D-sedoheptulose 7-phosphate isomerase